MESEVISVRVRKGTKQALKSAGVDVPGEVGRYLEDLASREGRKKALKELVQVIRANVKPSKKGWTVKTLREDRYEGH